MIITMICQVDDETWIRDANGEWKDLVSGMKRELWFECYPFEPVEMSQVVEDGTVEFKDDYLIYNYINKIRSLISQPDPIPEEVFDSLRNKVPSIDAAFKVVEVVGSFSDDDILLLAKAVREWTS